MAQFNVSMPALASFEFTVEAATAAEALEAVLNRKFENAAELSSGESVSCHSRVASPASMHEFGKDDHRAWYWPFITNLETGEDHDVEAD